MFNRSSIQNNIKQLLFNVCQLSIIEVTREQDWELSEIERQV